MENNRAKIGMLFFLASEAMFFAGLLSAYWVLRAQFSQWPPMGQPRFPVLVTGLNTLVLLASAWTIHQAARTTTQSRLRNTIIWLGLTCLAGLVFLSVQGYEWFRLLHFGLTATANIYGGLFYLLIGVHGAHVLTALIVLGVVFARATHGRYTAQAHSGITLAQMYWTFVVLVWPVIYLVVYAL